MPDIRLPDGSVRSFDQPLTGAELAASIAKSLAKNAVLMKVDGHYRDLSETLDADCAVEFLMRDNPEMLFHIRHDCAHVMAEAVKELWPDTQVTIGPPIENGYYYDFARDEPFTPEDFAAIEKRMAEIVDRDEPIIREVWDRRKAIDYFKSIGEHYKVELIEDLPEEEVISIYSQGNFTDLCRGPHMPSTGRLGKAFKLMRVAGAYWRGDHRNAMLQRIYGTCWATQKDLDAHLKQLEEAEKRDHRRLGKEMDLFHFQEEAPGSVFWHAKGWTLFQTLINYMRKRQEEAGYIEVNTPEVLDRQLWEKSGHWHWFGQNMFTTEPTEERIYAIKPMNCPGHVEIFKQGLKSYRELPYKIAEFGKVHRYEPSGALHGLMRVRAFTQDDAHIFCTPEQITEESLKVCDLLLSIYRDFGFTDVRVKFSDRPEERVGDEAVWDKSEAALLEALNATGLPYTLNPGEGAFYGPKLEFVLRDAIGRDWQCGTLQVDLNLPGRLGASFIDADSNRQIPVMLHRALFGSLERFTGILIEHYAGKLPLWLAPVQAVIAPIVSDADGYAAEVAALLRAAGVRVETDLRNEKINYKIREHSLAKVPVIVVVGKREAENRQVTLRRLGEEKQKTLGLQEAITLLEAEAKTITAPPEPEAVAAE